MFQSTSKTFFKSLHGENVIFSEKWFTIGTFNTFDNTQNTINWIGKTRINVIDSLIWRRVERDSKMFFLRLLTLRPDEIISSKGISKTDSETETRDCTNILEHNVSSQTTKPRINYKKGRKGHTNWNYIRGFLCRFCTCLTDCAIGTCPDENESDAPSTALGFADRFIVQKCEFILF